MSNVADGPPQVKAPLNKHDVRDIFVIANDLRHYAHTPARRAAIGHLIDRLAAKAEDLDDRLDASREIARQEQEASDV